VQEVYDQKGASKMKLSACGIDLAKAVFQVHGVDQTRSVSAVVCQSCILFDRHGSMWRLTALGAQAPGTGARSKVDEWKDGQVIRLRKQERCSRCACHLHGNAAAGSESCGDKDEAQQAVLAMHRIRQQLVKMRTAQLNALRGLVAEYGEAFGLGRKAFDSGMRSVL
jgi:hypothetical protein